MENISDRYIRKRVEHYYNKNIYSFVNRIVMGEYLRKNLLIGLVLFLVTILISIPMEGLFLAKVIAASIIFALILSFFTFFETIVPNDKKARILFLKRLEPL